ncbi:MAG: hypothetical protein JWO36_1373 [Myxococcales bacterium]|nr:hypothetical protein [Myxococcales bacterium]
MRALLAAVLVAGCTGRPSVTSCAADLQGVWVGSARWMILDQGPASVEVYPLFVDGGSSRDVIAAPRVIDLHREGTGLAGTIEKRFMHGADACDAHVPVHVTSCADDRLEVVLAEVSAPLAITPCSWPPPAPPQVEHWHRE